MVSDKLTIIWVAEKVKYISKVKLREVHLNHLMLQSSYASENQVASYAHAFRVPHAISEGGRCDEPKEHLRRKLGISQNYYFHHRTSPKYNNFQNAY